MNTIVKYVVGRTYKPLLEKYLSRKRIYTHNGFTLEIPPEVFHPGFFPSTRLLMQQLDQLPLNDKSLLELGAGSGLISFHAAKKGAVVTATDINKTAIEYLGVNSRLNYIGLKIVHSDLFDQLPGEQFDFIIINPPYYKRDAVTEKDLAWYCGRNGEYFEKLFNGLANYMHDQSEVLMVLCDGCDLQMIVDMARANGFTLDCINTNRNMLETNFIFKIRQKKGVETVNKFTEEYLALRTKEGRIYTDEELKALPSISNNHPHAKEWAARASSAKEFLGYLRLKGAKQILEVGCGNGWLSNMISSIPGSEVTAIDVNKEELEQGARVFSKTGNLRFLNAGLASESLKDEFFDVIVFAASIQYFENLDETLHLAMAHLKPDGEIHIIDSFFYSESGVKPARQRSKRYFEDIGFPLMMKYYFHHSMNSVKKYNYKILYNPKEHDKVKERVFPWIMIRSV